MKGIDVSIYQGDIDWRKVKADGIVFAMIKISQGGSINENKISPFNDKNYSKNLINATENGIYCGAYHYLTGTTVNDVKKEADFFTASLKPYKDKIIYPCAIDMEEDRYKKLAKDTNASLIKAFAEVVESAGMRSILYTNQDFSKNYINMDMVKNLDIWFATYYTPRNDNKKPDYFENITIWQWSEMGAVNGINGKVDLNKGYFDYAKNNQAENAKLKNGDTVEFKTEAKRYFSGGQIIPGWVKNDYYHVITAVTSRNAEVIKDGERCVLLGKKMSKTTDKLYEGINTWVSEKVLKKI